MLNEPGRDDHDADLDLSFSPAADPVDADDCRPLDDEREQVGYELFDWEPEQLDELDDRLHELDIAHEWVSDGFEVVVHVEDEERLDALLPVIRLEPGAEPMAEGTGDGVLGALFVAADRLQSGPAADAVSAFLDAAEQVGEEPPYGMGDDEWDRIVDAVDALIDLFHAGGSPEQIVEAATTLRADLRDLV